jgi:two-component system NtrC family sensor kinase
MRALLASMGDAVIVTDASLRITAWLGAAERLSGFTAMGRAPRDLLRAEFDVVALAAHRDLLAAGRPTRFQARSLRKDGTPIDVDVRVEPLRGDRGESSGFVMVARDVTDLLNAQREARRSDAWLRLVADHFPNGSIGLVDGEGVVLFLRGTANPTGSKLEHLRSGRVGDLVPVEVRGRLEQALRRARADEPIVLEYRSDGRFLETIVRAVEGEGFGKGHRLLVTQDVTDRHLLREHLAVQARLASLGTLVGGIAHEVNNPLAGALANVVHVTEKLRERERTPGIEDDIEALESARECIQRIARIVGDLTRMARPARGQEPVRLAEIATGSLRWLPATVGARAEIRLESGHAPMVHGSADQLEQVVAHLITNGAMAIPEGRRGTVVVRVGSTPDGRALVEVRDDGAGMEPGVLARVFDPFFTTRPVGQGMGLGLPVADAIVTAHGGILTASSTAGQGSTFRVELPPVRETVSPA